MGDLIGDVRVGRTRRAALSPTQIRHLATATAVTVLAADDLDVPDQAVGRLVDAVLPAIGGWLELRGVLLAADRLDNLIADTQRHLIDPAADRALRNPDLREILTLHQQYIDGMHEARNEVGSTAGNVLDRVVAATASQAAPAAEGTDTITALRSSTGLASSDGAPRPPRAR